MNDIDRAFELGKQRRSRDQVVAALIGKEELFASERLIPTAVPDRDRPKDERAPKWEYGTADELVADPKIKAALPMSAARVGGPFDDTLKSLDASPAVKKHLRKVVVEPLVSGSVNRIIAWLKAIIDYSRGEPLQAAPLGPGARRARRQRAAPVSRRALVEREVVGLERGGRRDVTVGDDDSVDADREHGGGDHGGGEDGERAHLVLPSFGCVMGRARRVRSDTQRSGREGSPAQRAGRALERADQVGGDPPAVEVALLRLHPLVVEPGGVDAAGVEGDVAASASKPGAGGVGPGDRAARRPPTAASR